MYGFLRKQYSNLYETLLKENDIWLWFIPIKQKLEYWTWTHFPFSTSAFVFLLTIVLDAMAFRFRATLLFELGKGHIFGFFIIIVFSFRKTFSLWFDHLHILFYRPVFPTTYLWFQIAAYRIFWSSLILTSISCWKIVFFK